MIEVSKQSADPAENQPISGTNSTFNHLALLERMGTTGRYQWIIFIISILAYIQNSLIATGISYLFMNPSFDCSHTGLTLTQQECEQYVCDNYSGQSLRAFPTDQDIVSLSTEFGPFMCQQNYLLGVFKGLPFIGVFFGVIVSTFMADNKSRRNSFLLFSLITCFSFLALTLSPNLVVAIIALIFANFGSLPLLRISQAIIAEITGPKLKQRFVSAFGAGLSLGGLLGGILYEVVKHWRYSSLYINLMSSLFILMVSYFLVKETPRFILLNSKDSEEAAEKFNQIGRLNGVAAQNSYKPEELIDKMVSEKQYQEVQSNVTIMDLFKYKSLRCKSILLTFVFIISDILFLSFNSVIEHIGLTPVINSTVISVCQMAAIPICLIMIPYFKRINIFTLMSGLAGVLCLAASFLSVPEDCQSEGGSFCSSGVGQLILMGLIRFCYSFSMSVIYLILIESYPTSIRTIGIGFPSAMGGFGSLLSQVLFVGAFEKGVNIFIFAGFWYFCMLCLMYFVPETKGNEAGDHIQEVQHEIMQKRILECQKKTSIQVCQN